MPLGAVGFGLLGAAGGFKLNPEPNYADAALLLPLHEAPGGGLSVKDYSQHDHAMTNGGATWQTLIAREYGGAASLSGATISSPVDSAFALGSGAWTIRANYRSTTKTNNTQFMQIGSDTYSIRFGYHDGGNIFYYISNNGSSWAANASFGAWSDGAFGNLELGYDGVNLYAFKDGVLGSTTAFSGPVYSNQNKVYLTPAATTGYLQDVAIFTGVCLHTSGFTPPGPMVS